MSKSTVLVRDLRDYATRKNLWWQNPLTNATDKGDICLEWWKDDRKLTAYVNTDLDTLGDGCATVKYFLAAIIASTTRQRNRQ